MSGVRSVLAAGAFTSACSRFTRKRTAPMDPAAACIGTMHGNDRVSVRCFCSTSPEATEQSCRTAGSCILLQHDVLVPHCKVNQPKEAVLAGLHSHWQVHQVVHLLLPKGGGPMLGELAGRSLSMPC